MSKALDKTYDGIIIGAGHHGLILGTYLARAGLRFCWSSGGSTYGGGLCTREVTLPGFYHNLHSINHFHISETPWFKDLDLGRARHLHHAALRVRPGASATAARWCSGATSKKRSPTSRASRKRTRRPSATGTARRKRSRREIFLPERYAEPLPQAEREALLSRTALGREFLRRVQPPAARCGRELFENEHVRLLFLFKVSLFGTWLVDTLSKTSPMGSVIRAFDLESGYQLCQGGSFNLARGLMEAFIAAGGTLSSRRSTSTASSSRTAARPASNSPTAARCAPRNSWLRRSTCIRPSRT